MLYFILSFFSGLGFGQFDFISLDDRLLLASVNNCKVGMESGFFDHMFCLGVFGSLISFF